jgi:hypothetical protein
MKIHDFYNFLKKTFLRKSSMTFSSFHNSLDFLKFLFVMNTVTININFFWIKNNLTISEKILTILRILTDLNINPDFFVFAGEKWNHLKMRFLKNSFYTKLLYMFVKLYDKFFFSKIIIFHHFEFILYFVFFFILIIFFLFHSNSVKWMFSKKLSFGKVVEMCKDACTNIFFSKKCILDIFILTCVMSCFLVVKHDKLQISHKNIFFNFFFQNHFFISELSIFLLVCKEMQSWIL